MSLTCTCPSATAIPSIDNVTCSQTMGQIQKIAICRLRDEDGEKIAFTTTDAITKLASWEAKLSATDSEKIIVTPFIYSPSESGGDARMSGGGNDDLGGVAEVLGANPVQFSGSLRAIPQAIAKALKNLTCESNVGNLGVFLFDENGNIEAIVDESVATTHYPIPVRAFFVGDKIHGNYDAKDNNPISWSYAEGYSDNLVIVKPEFNPLTDLQNA